MATATRTDFIESVTSEREDAEFGPGPTTYDISVYPADFTLQGLYDKWRSDTIRLPHFQRQFVWTISRASRLIESFLLGLPVPGIFLYKERETQHFLVIDGQQRLLSVFYFLRGLFKDEKAFRLTGLNTPWNGLTYEELDEPDRLRFQDSVLRATVVSQIHLEDNTSIYHIFNRLNTTSTPLSNQEIRNCIYWGKFNELINELNTTSEEWRAIVGKELPDNRQRDVELILRFYALFEHSSAYEKPMKEFLNDYMRERRNPTKPELARLRDLFERTTQVVVDELGFRPFHVRAGLNAAVFDSVFVALAKHLDDAQGCLADRYSRLIDDPDFIAVTTSATTDVDVVKDRLHLAESKLFSV